jgi:hypothetical protein
LVQAFIQEDEVPLVSTTDEASAAERAPEIICSVLAPWRGQQLRRIADKFVAQYDRLFGELVVLRTYYGGGTADDEKFRGWLEQADPFNEAFGGPDDRWWRVLDDAALFDLDSEEWQRVYDVLPELASPCPRRVFDDQDIANAKELVLAPGDEREPEEDDYEDAVMVTAASGQAFLLIADRQAFEENQFGLVFRDKKGNTVREGMITPKEVQYMLQYDFRGALHNSEYWLDAVVGSKYKTRGKIMRAVLPTVMAYQL